MADFATIVAGTWDAAFKGYMDTLVRHRPFYGLLEKKGCFKFDCAGRSPNWALTIKRRPMFTIVDGQPISFTRSDTLKRAQIETAMLGVQDAVTWKMKQMNRKEYRLIDLAAMAIERVKVDFKNHFARKILRNDASNADDWSGIPSIFSDAGGVVDGDLVVAPNSTYAGLSTAPAGLVPTAVEGDDEYRAFTPMQINTGYNGGSWANDVHFLTFEMVQRLAFSNDSTSMPTCFLVTQAAYGEAVDYAHANEQFFTAHRKGEGLLSKVGYSQTMFWHGVEMAWDVDLPASPPTATSANTFVGYALNLDEESGTDPAGPRIELMFYHKNVCVPMKDFHLDQLADRHLAVCLGNTMIRSPRHQGIFQDYA